MIIGLGHRARQGKDHAASTIQRVYPHCKTYSFAKELKLYCRDNHEDLYRRYPHVSTEYKEDPIYGFTPMLQYYGTDICRNQDPDVWIRAVVNRMKVEDPSLAVISDVRFPNEAHWVRASGGYLLDICRINPDGSPYRDPGRDADHYSETALDDFNWDARLMVMEGNLFFLEEMALAFVRAALDRSLQKNSPYGVIKNDWKHPWPRS